MVFTDFVVPGPAHMAALTLGMLLVVVLIYAVEPPITQPIILATVPWVISGATLHVFYQIHTEVGALFPAEFAPLFSAPSVYFTTFIMLGLIWVMSSIIVPSYTHHKKIALYIFAMGLGTMVPLVALVVWQGMGEALHLDPIMPVLGFVISVALTFVVFIAIGMWRTYIIAETRYVGALVLFGHIFDAITTAIGVEVMGYGERTLVPRMIMDFAADLPTEPYLGEAWLFVVIKILLASAIVIIFADYLYENPREGNLLFGIVAAVGLGPAVNNFFLFMLGV